MIFSPADARQLLDSVQKIEKSLKGIQITMADVLRATGKDMDDLQKKVKAVGDEGTESIKKFSKASEDAVELATHSWTDFATKVGAEWDKVTLKLREVEQHPALKMLFGSPDQAGAISGKSGGLFSSIGGLAKNLQSEVMTAMPAGGLIGLLLAGANREIQTTVQGNQMLNVFQASQRGGTSARDFGDRIKNMEIDMDVTNKVAAAMKALADAGISEDRALQATARSAKEFGGNLTEALVGMDKYFGMAEGSATQFAIVMNQDLGLSIDSAMEKVLQLGDRFKGGGASVQAFIGSILEAGSALRMQVHDVNDLVTTYGSLHGAVSDMYRGASEESITKTTLGAFKGLSQGIAGMNDLQKAFIGQRMGLGNDPLKNIRAVEMGLSGEGGGDFLQKMVSTFAQVGRQTVGTDTSRLEAFFKKSEGSPFNDPTLARIMADLSASMKPGEGGLGAFDPEKFKKAMEAAQKLREGEKDPIEKLIAAMQGAISSLGALILSLITGLMNSLISLASGIAAMIAGDRKGGMDIIKEGIGQELEKINTRKDSFIKTLGSDTGAAKAVKEIIGDVVGAGPVMTKEDVVKKRQARHGPAEGIMKEAALEKTILKGIGATGLGAGLELAVKTYHTFEWINGSDTTEPR